MEEIDWVVLHQWLTQLTAAYIGRRENFSGDQMTGKVSLEEVAEELLL